MSLGSRGRSGSSPPWAPDRGLRSLMMDEHCPLAGFTSDQRQTTADARCTASPPSALLSSAPPTLHSETAAGMKPSRHRWEKPTRSLKSEGKKRCGEREFCLFSSQSDFPVSPAPEWDTIKRLPVSFSVVTCYCRVATQQY